MKKQLLIGFVALGMALSAHAANITGGISMAGGPISTDTVDLSTANAITGFGTVVTTTTSGTYAPVAPGTVITTTTGFQFDPSFSPSPTVNVWRFVSGGLTYSFDLTSIDTFSQGTMANGTKFLDIAGIGTLHVTGFTDTTGNYILTANQAGQPVTFSFSASNGALVPDGGMTIAMLGMALTGLGLIRRKMTV